MYNREKIISVMEDIRAEIEQTTPYVVIAQPQRDPTNVSIQNLEGAPTHINFDGFSRALIKVYGQMVDVARNYLIEQALTTSAKYLLFIGDDVALPFDGFMELHKTAERNSNSIVSGIYYIKLSKPITIAKNESNATYIPDITPNQEFEIYQTGMDCLLIPLNILLKLKEDEPEIPFCCIDPSDNRIGEDTFFCHRIRKAGYKILVNTNVQCLHVEMQTGKYTAHENVNLSNYYTNIPITTPLIQADRVRIERNWTLNKQS